jgi:hypothetical protein
MSDLRFVAFIDEINNVEERKRRSSIPRDAFRNILRTAKLPISEYSTQYLYEDLMFVAERWHAYFVTNPPRWLVEWQLNGADLRKNPAAVLYPGPWRYFETPLYKSRRNGRRGEAPETALFLRLRDLYMELGGSKAIGSKGPLYRFVSACVDVIGGGISVPKPESFRILVMKAIKRRQGDLEGELDGDLEDELEDD